MVKTITVREEVYSKLLAMKQNEESFSDLFERLITCHSQQVLIKLRGSVDFENKEQVLSELRR